MEEIAMCIARAEIKKFEDVSSNAPIDEDDVAFMYLAGFRQHRQHGRRREEGGDVCGASLS